MTAPIRWEPRTGLSNTEWLNSVTSRILNTQRTAQDRQLSGAGDRDVVPLVYGYDRIGGKILNVAPVVPFVYIQVLWCHECYTYTANDFRLAGATLPSDVTEVSSYSGSQVTADSVFAAAMSANGVGYSDTLQGYAYSVFKMPVASFNGTLDFSVKIAGRKLYDPRKDSTLAGGSGAHRLGTPATWEFSDNPSLVLADFLYNSFYGCGQTVDWLSVQVAANANDTLIGGSEKSRIVGISFHDHLPVKTIAETLRAYAGCFLTAGANGIKLIPDVAGSYITTYTHNSGEIAAISPLEKTDIGNTPTVIEIVYTNTQYVPWRDASSITEASGVSAGTVPRRISQVAMPGVQRHSQATREGIERLNKLKTSDMSMMLDVFDGGIAHEIGDIIRVTHPVGISNKDFRIVGDPEYVDRGIWRLPCSEYDSAAYSSSLASGPSFPDTVFASPIPIRQGQNLLRNADWTEDLGYAGFRGDAKATPGWDLALNGANGLILRNYDNGHQYNFGRGGICHYIPNFASNEYMYSQQDIPFDGTNYPNLQFEVSAYVQTTRANVILYARVLDATKNTVIQDFTDTYSTSGADGDSQAGYVEGNFRRLWALVDISANANKTNARWLRILLLTQANQTVGSGLYPFVCWHRAMICRAPPGVTKATATPWIDGLPSVVDGQLSDTYGASWAGQSGTVGYYTLNDGRSDATWYNENSNVAFTPRTSGVAICQWNATVGRVTWSNLYGEGVRIRLALWDGSAYQYGSPVTVWPSDLAAISPRSKIAVQEKFLVTVGVTYTLYVQSIGYSSANVALAQLYDSKLTAEVTRK